ncbi:unnamed protein product [Rotaria sp. Silwood1]|nr:unnamed protein product [Rotaria sp. Silwood1]CAF0951225.1 unnamed protein product [Rotaria sp. Silwood1]CAF3362024.1 unnamed protein product [Rotaria sp. Silwood1]CAF4837190.1 unnamed protein product [Rotaria sp. Silwood1]
MKYSSVQLNDLPDEIILIILTNLNKLDVLYSFMGVNKRLNKIVHDPTFTSGLTLFNYLPCNCIYPLPHIMLDRLCIQILPKIAHNIKWLDLEPFSMKRILSTNYPNLVELGIYNIKKQTALNLFTGKTSLMHQFKKGILSLTIETINIQRETSTHLNTLMFTHIFNMFTNLQYLNFDPCFCYQRISFCCSPPTVFSSTLLELYIKVMYVQDCLCLLDGRFNQLRTFCVDIGIAPDPLIIPLLHRMSNLEQLSLYLSHAHRNRFINGNDLKQKIINYLPRLNQFRFNIRSTMLLNDQTDLPSNEDIRHTFKDFLNNEIISCVNYFLEYNEGECHIYSYPYTMRSYENITNNFPGGLFTCVCEVSLYDEHPFEHEFFIRIQKSFPFMERLSIINRKAQKDKQCKKLKNTNQDLLIIEYSHLKCLILDEVHYDYVEQFLLDTKACLPYGVNLHIDYQPLKRVTYNFKRNATRINCSKVRYICSDTTFRFPKHFKNYFLDIDVW